MTAGDANRGMPNELYRASTVPMNAGNRPDVLNLSQSAPNSIPTTPDTSRPATPMNSGGNRTKRIALFIDGTWNKPESNTNVWRICNMVADHDSNGMKQVSYYEKGVGTGWTDQLFGGMFGLGIDDYIAASYTYLMNTYNDDDELFIFGFSRGAFTCRSLMGVIDQCGLLKAGTPLTVKQLYERYRQDCPENPNPPASIDTILANKEQYDMQDHFVEYMLGKFSRKIKFTFMGIFDTVMSVGVPLGNIYIPGISEKAMDYNKIGVSDSIVSARHALAIDEHRFGFKPKLWTDINPLPGIHSKFLKDGVSKYHHQIGMAHIVLSC